MPMLRRTIRWPCVAAGAASFVAAHVAETVLWQRLFDRVGAFQPWFLNTGLALGFMVIWLTTTGAIVEIAGARRSSREEWPVRAASTAFGAAAAVAAVLVFTGQGRLFPIALLVGAFAVAVSVGAGAALVAQAGRTN
jgi:hypothetical protein